MGYYSDISLKTTTEGFLIIKKFHDEIKSAIKSEHDLFLIDLDAEISKTPTGFYKIEYKEVKWYAESDYVEDFEKVLYLLKQANIPYSFIRIGEDSNDIECYKNYTSDMPYEITDHEPERTIYDPDEGNYEIIKLDS